MPVTRHVERHFTSGDTVRDIVIGMSDGLTVPFALAAGLSAAIESTNYRLHCRAVLLEDLHHPEDRLRSDSVSPPPFSQSHS